MGSDDWLECFSCSTSLMQPWPSTSNDSSFSIIIGWLRFIFLYPCPQRTLLSSINILFLLLVSVSAIKRKVFSNGPSVSGSRKPLIDRKTVLSVTKTTFWYKLSLIATLFVAMISLLSCIRALEGSIQGSWKVVDALFWFIQSMTSLVVSVLIVNQKKSEAVLHSLCLRIYWTASFIAHAFIYTSAMIRLASLPRTLPELLFDDAASLLVFVFSIVLLLISIKGSTGIVLCIDSETSYDPISKVGEAEVDTSGFATASFVSQIFYLWMNPLVRKGYKSPLKIDDVPILSPEHRADIIGDQFERNWPKPEEKSNHPVGTVIFQPP